MESIFRRLKREIEYAKKSASARELLYQAYGKIVMAFEVGILEKDEYMQLNHECISEGINNPKYF